MRKALLMCAVQETYYNAHISCRTNIMLLVGGINPYVEIKQFLLEVLFDYNEVKMCECVYTWLFINDGISVVLSPTFCQQVGIIVLYRVFFRPT